MICYAVNDIMIYIQSLITQHEIESYLNLCIFEYCRALFSQGECNPVATTICLLKRKLPTPECFPLSLATESEKMLHNNTFSISLFTITQMRSQLRRHQQLKHAPRYVRRMHARPPLHIVLASNLVLQMQAFATLQPHIRHARLVQIRKVCRVYAVAELLLFLSGDLRRRH